MENILYSTNCPKCQILEYKLRDKKIPFIIINDINKMPQTVVDSNTVPWFETEGKLMNYKETVQWINNL